MSKIQSDETIWSFLDVSTCIIISNVDLPRVFQSLCAPSTGLLDVFSQLSHVVHYLGFLLTAYTLLVGQRKQ